MRKKFVYFVLIPAVIIILAVVLFIDTWLTMGLEAGGEAAVGAKVEIEGLHVSLSPLGIRWARLQVADPHDGWHNLFETRNVRFAMDFGQLLRAKYIIQTMEIDELILGTKRTTDGSLPHRAAQPGAAGAGDSSFTARAQGALQSTGEKAPPAASGIAGLHLNADSLVKSLDIHTLKYLDSLKSRALASSQQWNASLADLESSKKKLADLETGIKSINTSQLNSLPAITGAITTVESSVKGINEISAAFNTRRESIQSDIQKLNSSAGAVGEIAGQDFDRLKRMAKLPNLSTTGVARLLVGEETVKKATTYLSYVDWVRAHVRNSSSKPDVTAPPRMRGQTIVFPLERAYPKFLIEKIRVSGGTDTAGTGTAIRVRGEIDNVTNDQRVTHVPITAVLDGVEGGGRTFHLKAVIDRTKDVPYDEYEASLGGVPLSEFALGREGFLSAKIADARMSSTVRVLVPGSAFDANVKSTLADFRITFGAEPKGTLEGIIRDVLRDIHEFEVGFRLWTTGGTFALALSTDLDEKIAARASAVLGAEFTKAEAELHAKLDAAIAGKKSEVMKLVGERTADVQKQLAAFQSLLGDKLALADAKKKELSDRLDKEKKGKVNDALKGLFKK
ncbi:MAG TPA: TIGR03545 family protein [Bacteroidota bacterium]|nr:TIGR03545 family protein [Bacteroidota bacterium]